MEVESKLAANAGGSLTSFMDLELFRSISSRNDSNSLKLV